ncbi:MAG: hypothetical protein WBW53_09430 [Terriglobales bacterium]
MRTASVPTLLRWIRRQWLLVLLLGACAQAQVCQDAQDMDASVRTALETAAQRYFGMSASGDTAGLKENSIPSVAANFAGIEAAVRENRAAFSGAQATVRPPFLLTADGSQPMARAEFLCGVFGPSGQTKDSAVFVLNNLPPGKYGVVILDVNGGAKALTLILQQIGSDWRLAGYYATSSQADGHDAAWYAQRARDFKTRGETHNAWLYYREAIALATPVDFMSTLATDKLYDESQAVAPSDFPVNGKTVDLNAGGGSYRITAIFPLAVGSDLDVIVKYEVADVSNTAATFQENMALIKALVGKFPELRDAFAGVVAHAVDPSGHDYGTLLAMKEIK